MAKSRTILIAGAGIGGLTAALFLADRGWRVVMLEQSVQLQETGAGVQLSPNASRVLIGLGLGERLRDAVTAPVAIRIRKAAGGDDLAVLPVDKAESWYGAPFWTIHRGDLHGVLLAAARERPDIVIKTGTRLDDFAYHPDGVTVACFGGGDGSDEFGAGLIGADGLWSRVRFRLGDRSPPRPAGRAAWRALVPAERVAPEMREAVVHLWLGPKAHLVHYPVRGGRFVNVVAIAVRREVETRWNAPALPDEVLANFPAADWAEPARRLLAEPAQWLRWTLHDRPPSPNWGRGPVTLLGDAAHPMLPFLAQGAAMAIEDAAVLAAMTDRHPHSLASAMRAYEAERRERTADVQRAARSNDRVYHVGGPAALARDFVLRTLMGGELLLSRYDWIYDWRPPALATPSPAAA